MQGDIAPFAAFAALVLAAVRLGGGLYECGLIDRVWPTNPALIQPGRGGIDRKRFWMPAHLAFEAALILALWSAWPVVAVRNWLLLAAAAHLLMRVWSFAYFVPRALRFERAGDLSAEQRDAARTWVRLSVWRLPLDLISLAALCAAVATLLASR
jgi:hypothetical protein